MEFLSSLSLKTFKSNMMHVKYKTSLVVMISLFLTKSFASSVEVTMITEIVKKFQQCSQIVQFSCNFSESIALQKKLAENGYLSLIFGLSISALYDMVPPNIIVFVISLKCNGSRQFLLSANKKELFSSPYRWIIFSNITENDHYITHIFKNLDILVDSDVQLIQPKENENYTIRKIYKTEPTGMYVLEDVGYFDQTYALLLNQKIRTPNAVRRKNLMGSTLNTCLVITNNDTFNHLRDKRDKHIDTIAKVNFILVEHLGNYINASLNYSVKQTWGYKDNKSDWSGMIGALTRKDAIIGGTPLFFTIDRIPVIDYLAMTSPTKSKFVFRQPKLSYVTNVYTLPFHWSVWLSTMALVALTAFFLYFVVRWEWSKRNYRDKTREPIGNELHPSWADVLFLSFGAMCQQGAPAIPYGISGRIITLLTFLALMFLYTSYSANIVALLQSSSNSIKSLNDLLHSRLTLGVDDTVFNHFYFPNATEPVRKAIYEQKVAPPGQIPRFLPIAEGVKRLRQGLFAFHMETGAGYKIVGETFMEDEKCGLQEIEFLQVPDPYLAVQKNTSYREMFKIGLRLIHESGLQTREVSLLYTRKPQCVTRGSSFVSVSIVDCYAAAAVFAIGIAASFGIFLLEIYLNHRIKYYRRKLREFKLKKADKACFA